LMATESDGDAVGTESHPSCEPFASHSRSCFVCNGSLDFLPRARGCERRNRLKAFFKGRADRHDFDILLFETKPHPVFGLEPKSSSNFDRNGDLPLVTYTTYHISQRITSIQSKARLS